MAAAPAMPLSQAYKSWLTTNLSGQQQRYAGRSNLKGVVASCDCNYGLVASWSGRGGSRAWSGNCGFTGGSGNLALRRSNTRHGKIRSSLQRGVDPRAQDKETTVKEIAELAESLVALKRAIGTGYRAIGPEMRDRVDRLYDRVLLIQESADRGVTNQLTANLRALQREHGSLENIVRLAMQAGPAPTKIGTDDGMPDTHGDPKLDPAKNVELEAVKPKASVFQSLIRESALNPMKVSSNYVMTSPASQGSSPLAAFRAEIERRVMEQLAGKRLDSAVKATSGIITRTVLPAAENESQAAEKRQVTEEKKPVENESLGSNSNDDNVQENISSGAGASDSTLIAKVEAVVRSTETESLKNNVARMREEILELKQVSVRADMAENRLQQLERDMPKSIPLDVHDQMVRRIRTSLTDARVKVLQVTSEVREKEAMLEAVKNQMLADQEKLVQRVRELTGDVARRVSIEEMESAVSYAVAEVEKELEKVHQRAMSLSLELEKKEILLVQQQREWDMVRESLEMELESVKQRLQGVEEKRASERAQLIEAQQKVKVLEEELTRIRDGEEEAQILRLKNKKETLATVRILISHMVQSARAREKSDAQAISLAREMSKLQDENKALELTRKAAEEKAELAEAEVRGMKSSLVSVEREVENLQGAFLSGEKTSALGKFFAAMAQLIKKENEKMQTAPYKLLQTDRFAGRKDVDASGNDTLTSLGDFGEKGDRETKNMVTLYYESSWEWAYLHFKADESGWTEIPGVMMQNDRDALDSQLKVLTIEASSVEFVLNNGKGSWDSAPGGKNYYISESGSYLLSAGHLKKVE